MLSVSAADCLRAGEPESLTVKVTEPLVTGAAGVPEITPVATASDKPAGSDPLLTDQAYGAVPPEAASVALYAVPTVPLGTDDVEITSGAGAMLTVRLLVVTCCGLPESVTLNVNARLDVTSTGVPLSVAVEPFKERPRGSTPPLTDQDRGICPPRAFSVAE
jgi:hypothetical protein